MELLNRHTAVKRLCIRVAGITVALHMPVCSAADVAFERYAPFTTDCNADYEFDLGWLDAPYGVNTGVAAESGGGLSISGDDFSMRIDGDSRRGTCESVPDIYSLDSMMRVFYSMALAWRGGLLLHAAGVVRGGAAYVFAGRSGSGKTTAAGFAPAGGILSDELTAVLPGESGPAAHGTPFMGEMGSGSSNISAPVKTFYFLSRAGEHRNREITLNIAVARMLVTAMNFDPGPERAALLLDNAAALCGAAKCSELCYDKNSNLWEIIDNARV